MISWTLKDDLLKAAFCSWAKLGFSGSFIPAPRPVRQFYGAYLLLLESSVCSHKGLHNFLSKTGSESLHDLHVHIGFFSWEVIWEAVRKAVVRTGFWRTPLWPVTSLQRAGMRTRVFVFCSSVQCSTSPGALSLYSDSGINHITSDSRSGLKCAFRLVCLSVSSQHNSSFFLLNSSDVSQRSSVISLR